MTEFQLYTAGGKVGRARPYDKLSLFAQGYVEAMFFTNGDTGDDDENRLNNLGVHKLTAAACADIAETCDAFLARPGVRQMLDKAAELTSYSEEQAGRDFWFTRQGHGTGFWARSEDELPSMLGELLADIARGFGEAEVYVKKGGWIEHVG